LQKKGFGIFQNLYKAKFNELPIYKPAGAQIGVLNCDPDAKSSVSSEQFIGAGGHRYKIELRDFWGNLTTVSGEFIVDKSKDLATEFAEKSNGNFLANNLSNENDSFISRPKFSISRDSGISWLEQSYSTLHSDSLSAIDSMPGYELQNVSPVDIFKTDTITQNGQSEIPLFHPINNSSSHNNATNKLFVEKDFFNDFIRIKISAKFKLLASPKVSVQQAGSAPTELSIFQKRINEFVGVYPIQSGKDGLFSLSVLANEKTDKPIFYHEQFDLQTVTPFEGGSITSPDGDCQLAFTGNNVYENLFLRLKEYKSYQNGRYDMVGAIYEIFPQDVLLKGKGTLTLHYPQSDTMPEKLGIYGENKNNWRFIGNKLDKHNQAVRTEISSLNTYTLIRDILPPVISIMQPMKNARLSNNKPKILVQVYDSLSGLASERSILIKLDGQKVIAEYDPEAKLVKFECEDPLLPGEHQITVIAVDNCKNQSQAVQSFFVIQ
jgi:hypothetical protein